MNSLALFYPTVLIASFISTIAGFGTAIILLSFGTFFFDIKEIMGIATVIFLWNNITKEFLFYKYLNWRVALYMLLGAAPFVIIGALLTDYLPSEILRKILGVIIFLFVLNKLFPFLKTGKKKMANLKVAVGGGVYGFFSGLIGSGSVFKTIILLNAKLKKEAFIATFCIPAIFMNTAKIIVYSKYEFISAENIHIALYALFASLTGVLVGRYVLQKYVSDRTFEIFVYIILIISAIKLLI